MPRRMDQQPVETAPRDRVIDVLTRDGVWVRAYWAQQTQAFVRWDDQERRTLRVTAWREAPAVLLSDRPPHVRR